MSVQDIERWSSQAQTLEPDASGLPILVAIQEGEQAALYLTRHWEPDAAHGLPGLRSVEAYLPLATAEELGSLARAVRTLHTRTLFVSDATPQAEVDRAQHLTRELGAALTFVLDDGREQPEDRVLGEIKTREAEDGSRASLVQALSDYAELGAACREQLAQLVGFDGTMVDEARTLADRLGALGTPVAGRAASPDVRLRDQLLTLLNQRVGAIRRAAQFVFRDHPELARQAGSAYQRRRRAQNRRSAVAGVGDGAVSAGPEA